MSRVKDPDTVLRIALRCDELHHQGKTVDEIVQTVLSEGFVRKNGQAVHRHQVLSAMYRLCGWYVPSKGKLKHSRRDIAPLHGHHRQKRTYSTKRRYRPSENHIPKTSNVVYWSAFISFWLIVAGVIYFRG